MNVSVCLTILVLTALSVVQFATGWGGRIRATHDVSDMGVLLEQRLIQIRGTINTNSPVDFLRTWAVNPSQQVLFNPMVAENLNLTPRFEAAFAPLKCAGTLTEPCWEVIQFQGKDYSLTYSVSLERAVVESLTEQRSLEDCNSACQLNEIAVIHVRVRATSSDNQPLSQLRDLYISI